MADIKKAWYSVTGKSDVLKTDKILIYDGTTSYTAELDTLKNLTFTSANDKLSPNDSDKVIVYENGIPFKVDVSKVRGTGTGGSIDIDTVTEKLSANDTDKILVFENSDMYKVSVDKIKGVKNVTDTYAEFTGADGKQYRVQVDSAGNLYAIKSEAYTSTLPLPTDNTNPKYQALIINQVYGGGDALSDAAVSHSFIELYNLSANDLNLRGIYLWYKSGTSAWESAELIGIIPPYSSFLIRGSQHNSLFKDTARLKIKNFDMELKDSNGNLKKLPSNGISVHLTIGNATPGTNPLRKTTDVGGTTTVHPAYLDLLGCGGTNPATHTVSAYETNYRFGMSTNCACRRVDFYNGGAAKDISGYSNGVGDNAFDTEIIDYSVCDVEKYRPRYSKEGSWDMFVSKDQINLNAPNYFILGYGQADTTRTFTWQSKIMKQGFVKYREIGTTDFITVKAITSILQHPDTTVSKHSCIVKNLVYGKTYEYQVGSEGYWSDLAKFDVKDKKNQEIKILWMSDEQSWTEDEGNTFKNVFEGISSQWNNEAQTTDIKMSEFDFILETGDISQNGRRRNEYGYYFNNLKNYNKTKPIMSCMGNNDLLDKKYGQCFANFFTNENKWANSVYTYTVGNVEFIGLNSNTDYDYVTGFGKLGNYQSTHAFLLAQAQWLDNYLTTRTTTPVWTIIYMHQSPFTCVRVDRCQVFTSVFEKHKIPLVLCGHQHMYARSIPIYSGYPAVTTAGTFPPYNTYFNFNTGKATTYVDEQASGIKHTADVGRGTHYVMINASGFKNNGKETHITQYPTSAVNGYDYNVNGHTDGRVWWNEVSNTISSPNYATIKITESNIIINSYLVTGAKSTEILNGISYEVSTKESDLAMTRTLIDTLTINKTDRI